MEPQNNLPQNQAPIPQDGPTFNPVNTSQTPALAPKNKPRRKKIITLVVILLVAAAAAGAWSYQNRDKPQPATSTNNQPVQPATPELQPSALSYAVGSPLEAQASFRLGKLGSDAYTVSHTLPKKVYISKSVVYKNQVVVVTSGGDGSKEGVNVLYSKDAGKTFTSLFAGGATTGNALGDQVTDIKFSDDGKKLVMGYLPAARTLNTVKELDPATKATRDLFSTKEIGVFIEAYSPAKKEILYFSGCYNCDGNKQNKLLKRDLATDKETVAYEDSARYGMETVVNHDLSKALILKGSDGSEGIGGGSPYDLVEVDLKTKATTAIFSNYKSGYPAVGYLDGSDAVYYTKGKDLYQHKKGGDAVLFSSPQELLSVHFVNDITAVTTSGTYEKSTISSIDLKSKKATRLLGGDENTTIFGVTWE